MNTPTVLVVDDTAGNRYAVSRLLRASGIQVREATTGADALESMDPVPDLVILDINLPDMTGYEVCEQIKAHPRTSFVPVLHISASYTASADRAYGLEAGAEAYLTHPLDPPVFIATVRSLLRTARAESDSRRAAQRWHATFQAMEDGIVVIGTGNVVLQCNSSAEKMLGGEPSSTFVGRSWLEASALIDAHGVGSLDDILHTPLVDLSATSGSRSLRINSFGMDGQGSPEALAVCVISDVTLERAAQEEREQLLINSERARADADSARREAEDANRAKSDFLAIMSHELRTPLNAIGGFAELIALGIRGPVTDEQQRDLERIKKSQLTLIALINDLLRFAKLESGSLRYEIEEFDAEAALIAASDIVESQMAAKNMKFERSFCSDITLNADPDKFQQILLNLLTNAVKFTDESGVISIACDLDNNEAIVNVTDNGRGIPPEKIASIFDPFMQVDQRLVRENHGVGLGLAISRDLARAMGGDITVNSVLGEGSTFTLKLPARKA